MHRYSNFIRLCLRTSKKYFYQWKFRVRQETILLEKNWFFAKNRFFHALNMRGLGKEKKHSNKKERKKLNVLISWKIFCKSAKHFRIVVKRKAVNLKKVARIPYFNIGVVNISCYLLVLFSRRELLSIILIKNLILGNYQMWYIYYLFLIP